MTANTEYLPQSESADWFLVIDPKEGIVHHAYSAELGRSFGHDHIKDAQIQGEASAKRWVVRPAYAAPNADTVKKAQRYDWLRDVSVPPAQLLSERPRRIQGCEVFQGASRCCYRRCYCRTVPK